MDTPHQSKIDGQIDKSQGSKDISIQQVQPIDGAP